MSDDGAPSMIGQSLSHYRITEKIGAGGMGEVFRATDTSLGREVAIKTLPEEFAHDPQRLSRFAREAQLLAALSHPNIAAIYGLEELDGVKFLVLEMVPGETLDLSISRAALSMDDSLEIACQLAAGLEAAHEKGILHRDLKPQNIKLTPEGKVKVLDFGLAKAFLEDDSSKDLSRSPTLTAAATRAGVILGTTAYMSPEQARGKPVDKRTDLWSFGCVLYELLSGAQAFHGETISDTISAVLRSEPDWSRLPADTPALVVRLLHRCLEKDVQRRLHDAGDARLELEEARQGSGALPGVSGPRVDAFRFGWRMLAAAAALAIVLGGAAAWLLKPAANKSSLVGLRLAVTLPAGDSVAFNDQTSVAISPDGARIVFLGRHEAESQLYLRPLDKFEATPSPGTRGASAPFFSPDGQWIAFAAAGKLMKVSVQGGPAVPLCEIQGFRGGSWGEDDFIVFSPSATSPLMRIQATGGTPKPVSQLGPDERTHRWPEILPGGKAVLFTVARKSSPDYYFDAQIDVVSLETGERKTLVRGGTNPHYLTTGQILFTREGGMHVAPFDPQRLEVTGPPIAVLNAVALQVDTGAVHAAVSRTGTLVYVPGSSSGAEQRPVWVDRKGGIEEIPVEAHAFQEPRLSPDGKRVAISVLSGPQNDIWILDLGRGALTRLTSERGGSWSPVWSPDGRHVYYVVERDGKNFVNAKSADGSGPEEKISREIPGGGLVDSISPDGHNLFLSITPPGEQQKIFALSLDGERKPRPLRETSFVDDAAMISPDGRWLAYVSDESGRNEIYAQAYPKPGGKYQVSTAGGDTPAWSRDGRELFFRSAGALMSAPISTEPSFAAGAPRALFPVQFVATHRSNVNTYYDVSPDGRRFLMIRGAGADAGSTQLNVIPNWFEELKQLSAPRK